MKKVYIITGIDCANCAAKIEQKFAKVPGVEEVSITFATEQLRLTAADPDALIPALLKIARDSEPDTQIAPRDAKRPAAHSHAEHEHHHHPCDCGCEDEEEHEHHHHHHDDDDEHAHHHHHCDCGCEDEEEHEHHHHHQDDDDEHAHHHHHCDCGCEDEHEHHEHHHHAASGKGVKKVYKITGIDCANCAAKIERNINNIPGVEDATITFATEQLRLTAADPDALIPAILAVARDEEPEAEITPLESKPQPAAAEKKKDTDLIAILTGTGLFVVGLFLKWLNLTIPADIAFVAGYLVLGLPVLKAAGGNLLKGHMLDENFLMSIATLGAFAMGSFTEAIGVMLFYRIGEYFEEKAVARSRSQIMEAVDLRPEVVTLEKGAVIPAGEAQVGDVLRILPGDRIPLDGVILTGESRLDTAPITGEPVPVHVGVGDSVTSGCVNTSGSLTMQVEKPLSESMVTRILDSVENAAASKPKIDRFITRFSRIYTPVVVGLSLAVAVIPPLFDHQWHQWIYTALSFLVMSCPCALVLSVPLAFFSGIGAGSKRGILFKGGVSIEAMAAVKAVAMDKTGTVTRGDFRVQEVVGGDDILALCASCEQDSTHPIAVSILQAAKGQGLLLERPTALEEIAGHGLKATVEGKTVLCGNSRLMDREGVSTKGFARKGSGTWVLVAVDGKLTGGVRIADTVKPEAQSAIGELKKMNVSTAMLTGDGQSSADAVAKALNIDEVHAKLLPADKLNMLQDIRTRRGSVMFVGDGINDAPVLAGADVGAAMGSGADAAIEAADVVYMTSSVEAIPTSLKIARRTRRVAWQNVWFALAIKLIVMVLGLTGHASMWMAVFADSGVAMLCVLNSIRLLYTKH